MYQLTGEMVLSSHCIVYKEKGAKTNFNSYHPITLSSVPGKVFAHILIARIQPLISITWRPQQSGFAVGRSTIDAILALWLLSDHHLKFNCPLHVTYLDISCNSFSEESIFSNGISSFNPVDWNALWKAIWGRSVPNFLFKLIKSLHKGTGTRICCGKRHHRDFSQVLESDKGVFLLLVSFQWP